MSNSAASSPLGKSSEYRDTYSPELLFPIPRSTNRLQLGIAGNAALPFDGVDIWNSYEFSWLTPSGKPAVALVEFRVPANSPNLIESKSFKLYLNSFNQTVFDSLEKIRQILEHDLSAAAGGRVAVRLSDIHDTLAYSVTSPHAQCIDALEVQIASYSHPSVSMLKASACHDTTEQLCSHLLKSNCPVTGQPDWGSVFINYQADNKLDQASLLQYIVSFRQHADFHEHCVERIFMDLYTLLAPRQLEVYARYTRRGGLDINPYRTLDAHGVSHNRRLVRQ